MGSVSSFYPPCMHLPDSKRLSAAPFPLCALLVFLAGCREREIRTYQTPKDGSDLVTPAQQESQAVPSVVVDSAPHWKAPDSWKVQALSGMRVASFSVSDVNGGTADISVISFGGTGGDELANVNRWRGQLKLPPITSEGLPAALTTVSTEAGDFSLVDLRADQGEAGKPPAGTLGAWLHRGAKSYFFKITGPAELVASQKTLFIEFLKSVTFSGPAATASSNTNDLPKAPAGMTEMPAMPASPALPGGGALKSAEGSNLKWNAPATWTIKTGSSMRKGSYALGADGAVDLAITAFPGDVGGPLANVNRWLGQVGLPQIEEAVLPQYTSHMDSNGLTFFLVDTGSKDPSHPQRIVAGVVFWQGNSWFFKMTGPTDQVAKEKQPFIDFLQTVRTP